MKIPVACAGCHRQYEVDERFAGKTLKCAYCEKSMSVPVAEGAAQQPLRAIDEYELDDPGEAVGSTFRPARTKSDEEPAGLQRTGGVKKKKTRLSTKKRERRREPAESILSNPTVLITFVTVAVVLAILGYFVPGLRRTAGVTLALPGLALCLYGYASGVYIAFTEDDLYGWLFLLFPFYAAYYVVSRWDEMRSRLIMVGVGLALLTIGGQFLETDRAREKSVTPEAAAKV
jgi:hypothetical protein